MTPPTVGGSPPHSIEIIPPHMCSEICFTSDERLTQVITAELYWKPFADNAWTKLLLDFTNEITYCLLSLCFISHCQQKLK